MKIHTRINKLLTALLVLCVLFVCMAGSAMAEGNVASVTINGETTYYTSIKEAVAKANESGNATITLLQSTTTRERLDFTRSATLDLNGNTLSCATYFSDDYDTMVAVTTDGAELTIIDSIGGGKLDGTGTTFVLFLGEPWAVGFTYTSSAHISGGTVSGWVRMQSGTSMTVSGGTVENNTSSSTVEMYSETTLNVSGGQILNTYEYGNTRCAINNGNGGTVNITGGTVSGYIGVSNKGTANISGNANITGTERSVVSSDGALTISGGSYTGGIVVSGGTATISNGTITESSAENAVEVSGSAGLTISGGTFSATAGGTWDTGVYVHDGGTVKITGGTITSKAYGVYNERGSATITGGSISGGTVDLYVGGSDSVLNLTLDEGKTEGATFPDGITVERITLAELLATDTATYWGVVDGKDTMLTVDASATSITDKGDITIRAICTHPEDSITATDNGDDTHTPVCSDCNKIISEATEHSGGTATCKEQAKCEACGASYGDVGGHSTTADGDRAATCKELAYCSVCQSEYGEVNPDNHASDNYTYADNGDGTHTKTHECGVTVDESEDHTIENHVCTACGAMEIVVNFDAGDYEWKTGDQFCLIRVAELLDDCVFTATVAEDGTVTWTADKPFCWYGEGEQKLFAAPNNGWSIDYFVIPEDQSTPAKLEEADLVNAMWAGNPTPNTITFNMKHRMAKVTVNYEFAEGVSADISELKVYSIAWIFRFSIDDWSIITSAGQYDVWVTPYHNGNQFTAFISPETYSTGEDFIKITLSDGSVREVKMNKAVTFAEGEEYTYKVIITADGAYLVCADGCTNFTYTDNEDGTHDKVCTDCGKVEVDNENHTPNAVGYTVGTDGKHSFTCVCGATVIEDHDHTNGKCVCGVKATPTYTVPANLTATYGDALADVTLPNGFTWQDATTTTVGNAGSNTFKVTYTPDDTDNYETVTDIEVAIAVAQADIANAAAAEIPVQVYDNGNAITPEPVLTFKNETLVKDTDYTLSYSDNTAEGTAAITITGMGNFTGTKTVTFEIVTHEHVWMYTASGDTITASCEGEIGECPVENSTVTIQLNAPENLTYDGTAKTVTVTQTPEVVFNDIPAVEYEGDCQNCGTHTAKLTYNGVTAALTFTIGQKSIDGASIGAFAGMTYNGAAQTPNATVTIDGLTVTGSWSPVTNVGEKSTFTASDNFTGTLEADPGMSPKTITITGATIEDVLYQEDGQYTLNVTGVSFGDENFANLEEELVLGTDYTATAVLDGENAVGEVTVLGTVTLLNKNYTLGTANDFRAPVNIVVHTHVWTYTVNGDSIIATCSGTIGTCPDNEQSVTLNAPGAIYSGNPVNAEVTRDGADLTYTLHYTGTDYASADAPINAGDYTVTMTVGDKYIEKDFTISPKDISVVASCEFSLVETSFTYSGEAPALKVTGKDSSVGNYTMREGTDYTVGTVQVNAGSHKLTVTGKGNYTGTVELDYEITKAVPVVEDFIFTAPADLVYDGTEKAASVTTDKTGMGEISVSYYRPGGAPEFAADPIDANDYLVAIDVAEGDNYQAVNDLTSSDWRFEITISDAQVSASADKESYTYGDTITVTATCTAKPATFALRSAIAPDQMALFLGDVQLTEAVDAVNGTYTMTVNTAGKALDIGENTLRVVYISNGNLKDAEATVTVTLKKKELTIISAEADGREYAQGNMLVDVTGVTLEGIVDTDDVGADLTDIQGTLPSDNAGTYTTLALPRMYPFGADAEYYIIAADDAVTTSVEITAKEITNPTIVLEANSLVYDGTEKQPAVVSVKDGENLIDAAEYTVSYTNNIEMGTATVTLTDVEGGNYNVSGSTTFQITQSGTDMTATADKASYTYGETITVTGTVKATGTAPAATLTLRSAPAAQQVALFAADGTQLTEPANVVNGAYTLTYNTTDKGILPADAITLTVKFVGDEDMADQSAVVTVALTAKSVEPVLSGSASKAYDGTDTVTDTSNLAINLNGIIAGDTVTAAAAGYAYADETVGQNKSITANSITLSGEDTIFYTLAQTEASAQIGEIKKAMLISVTEPADTTLDVYCADADTVIGKLPDTVIYHLSDGKTVELKVEWSCTAYDSTPGATNAFAWAVSDSDKLACYEIAQNVANDGTVIVTNSAFLPVTVTGTDAAIIYNGTTYDVTQMFAIDSNAGAAVFEIISGGTGEGALNGSVLTITKAGTITIKVTTAPNAAYAAGEATAILTISKGTPAVTAPTGLTAWYGQKLSDIALPTVDGGAWSWTDMNSTVGDSGVQIHQAIFTPTDTNLWNITTHNVSITVAQAGTSFGEMKVYNGDTETTTFTYGDTITVKAEATAVQPATFSLRSLIAPTKHQMALFIRNADGSEVQISEAVNAQNGVYTMTYNTAGKALSIGDNALIAKFVGDENMADYQETVLVTLNPKELTIVSLTAQDRVYEPGNQQVTLTGTEVSGKADANDDVSAIIAGMTATISSEDVGTYDTALIPQDVSLTGSHAGYYFATGNVSVSIPQGVEITQATPYTTSGTPAQPVFDPIYQDGMTLGDIPVSLADGTFNVPGTIEWEAADNTPVTEGTPFTWVFTPDDSNWKPVTGTVVIYPDGEPPVITAPAGDQEVTVYEGEQGTMTITAEDAASYQWYINRYDGLGYVPISGATSANYTTSVVNLGNNGFTYYCVASNAYGETESPVFLLQVLEKIEVPETGDQSNIALWIALSLLSIAGLTVIMMADRKGRITR